MNKNSKKQPSSNQSSNSKSSEITEIIFAFIFAGVMLALWWFLYQKPLIQKEQNEKYNVSIEQSSKSNTSNLQSNQSIKAEDVSVKSNLKNPSQKDLQNNLTNSSSIVFENKNLKTSISLRGLKINDLTLKNYSPSPKSNEKELTLISSNDTTGDKNGFIDFGFGALNNLEAGEIPNENSLWSLASAYDIQFIAKYLPQNFDIGVLSNNSTDADTNKKTNYTNKDIEISIKNNIADGATLFKWTGKSGLKFFILINNSNDNNPYLFNVLSFVFNNTNKNFNFYSYGRINKTANAEQINTNSMVHQGLSAYTSEKLEEISFKDIAKTGQSTIQTPNYPKTHQWLGFNTKYWFYGFYFDNLAVLNNDGSYAKQLKGFESIRFLKDNTDENKNSNGNQVYQVDFATKPVSLNANQVFFMSSELFLGAKKLNIISQPHYKKYKLFDRIIDFGIFYIFTKPMMIMLEFINNVIGNYGFSIILLTIFIKFLVYPLSAKSYLSMAKIKKLSPVIEKIKQNNKDKPSRVSQQEIAVLYKTEGVNPASGCLPLLLQMPIFFAIYKILTISIELRHAPFIFWINDLSARDPSSIFNLFGLLPFTPPAFLTIGVLPILMGLSMFLQQKMTPKTDNPMLNVSILAWMPLILTFVFSSFPAGLLIYWIINNLFSILQQLYFDKFSANKINIATKLNI